MMKLPALILPALILPTLLLSAAAHAQTQVNLTETAPVVTLNVTETVEAAPDVATVGTGVETRAPTAKQAMADNADKMTKLIAALTSAGIARKDIQTSGLRLNAQYDYNGRNPDGSQSTPKFIGYEAANQLSVTQRNVAKLGDLLDRMVAAGATSINGPNFSIEDPSPLHVQARGAALKTAKSQADFYAQQAGFRSARLVSITENNSGGLRPMQMDGMSVTAMKRSTPIEPGQVSAAVTLTVQYALER